MSHEITRAARELDNDTLTRAAREGLTLPSDFGRSDARVYSSHVPVISWADRGDDILAESNYATVSAYLEAFNDDGELIDASMSHWAFGSIRQLFVQVYVAPADGFDADRSDFTDIFREATAIAIHLRDEYPIFDESDYSAREWQAFESTMSDAIDDARTSFDDIDDATHHDIVTRVYELVSDGETWSTSDDVDYGQVKALYAIGRDEAYTLRARRYLDLSDIMAPLF